MKERFEAFTDAIAALHRCVQVLKRSEMKRYGLRSSHTMCLYYLGQHPAGLTVTQLTGYCREDKAAISRAMQEMRERGLVDQEGAGGKRHYRSRYFLTPAGRQMSASLTQTIGSVLEAGGRGLTDDQREAFYAALDIIRRNLEAFIAEDGME